MMTLTRRLLFAFIFFLALLPEDFGIRSKMLPDISVIRALLLLMVFSLILGLIGNRSMIARLKASYREFTYPILLMASFFGWGIFASLMAPSGVGTVATAIRDILYFFVPFIVGLVCLRGQRDVKIIAVLVGLSSSISALIGIFEYVSDLRPYALLTAADSAWNVFEFAKGGEYSGVLSTFPHPLAFGSFMVAALLFGLLIYTSERGIKKTGAIVVMVLCLIGIVASTSRGAQASLVAALAFALLIYMRKSYRRVQSAQRPLAMLVVIAPMVLVMVASVAAIGYGLAGGGSKQQLGSSMMRVVQLQYAVEPISQRPLLGYGVGQGPIALGMKSLTIDDYYLSIALESGLVALLLFIAMLGIFMLRAAKVYLAYRQPVFLVLAMFFAAESTQLLVLSLKQALPLLYVGFALLLVMQREMKLQARENNCSI